VNVSNLAGSIHDNLKNHRALIACPTSLFGISWLGLIDRNGRGDVTPDAVDTTVALSLGRGRFGCRRRLLLRKGQERIGITAAFTRRIAAPPLSACEHLGVFVLESLLFRAGSRGDAFRGHVAAHEEPGQQNSASSNRSA
jgi:hypothetical protein